MFTTKSAPAQFSFNVKDVPLFLQETEFFRSLDKDDDDAITLPKHVCKFDTVINSTYEARRCLSTMRFWGVAKPPVDLIKFVLIKPPEEMANLLAEFSDELKQIYWLEEVCRRLQIKEFFSFNHHKDLRVAIRIGGFILGVSFLICGKTWSAEVCTSAAKHNWLEGLTFLHENGFPWDATTCAAAAKVNSLQCLRYAREHGCPWDVHTVSNAIIWGSSACLRYAVDGGCPRPLRYAKIMPHFQDKKQWGDSTCGELARAGNLAALMFAHAHGCEWNCNVIINACMFGKMDCLEFALKNGCPGKEIAVLAIAGWAPFLDCLRDDYVDRLQFWAARCGRESARPFWEESRQIICGIFSEDRLMNVCRTEEDTLCLGISPTVDRVSLLRFALKHGCPWHKSTLAVAAKCGHIDVVQYVLDNHHPSQEEVCVAAARNWSTLQYAVFRGHALLPCAYEGAAQSDEPLKSVKFLHARGCPWDERACAAFAKFKRMDCLLFARANGAPWDASTAAGAATHLAHKASPSRFSFNEEVEQQALEFLRFVHESGCPWDSSTCVQAVEGGNVECLKYARDHGCPWDGMVWCAVYKMQIYWCNVGDCVEYMTLHECPPIEFKLKPLLALARDVLVPSVRMLVNDEKFWNLMYKTVWDDEIVRGPLA